DQEHAVRLLNDVDEALVVVFGEAELLDFRDAGRLFQDAHHGLLAVYGRQRRQAQVNRHVPVLEADAAVLGQAPFGDVQVAHDLDARHEGVGGLAVHAHVFAQGAVLAHPDQQSVGPGFDVNVGNVAQHGLADDGVDHLYQGVVV